MAKRQSLLALSDLKNDREDGIKRDLTRHDRGEKAKLDLVQHHDPDPLPNKLLAYR